MLDVSMPSESMYSKTMAKGLHFSSRQTNSFANIPIYAEELSSLYPPIFPPPFLLLLHRRTHDRLIRLTRQPLRGTCCIPQRLRHRRCQTTHQPNKTLRKERAGPYLERTRALRRVIATSQTRPGHRGSSARLLSALLLKSAHQPLIQEPPNEKGDIPLLACLSSGSILLPANTSGSPTTLCLGVRSGASPVPRPMLALPGTLPTVVPAILGARR